MEAFYLVKQQSAIEGVRRYYVTSEGRAADGLLDIEVSFDGTWMKRGHSSHIGIGFVIEYNTGIVLDLEVICNFCMDCARKEAALEPDELADWKQKHQPKCKKNFDGKSGAFEKEAAVRIWNRSTKLGLRYVTFLSDGDSSAFIGVNDLNDGKGPYEVPVVKEDCINHVTKRFGSRLRALKSKTKVLTTTRAGKQVMRSAYAGGLLTKTAIDALTGYFGQNLQNHDPNTDVATVRSSILASFWHSSSTDENPKHMACPIGADSWCWVRRAEAAVKVPDPHSKKKLLLGKMPQDLLKGIMEVYLDLTSDELLKRCLRKRTQNANESLHSKIWLRCSKGKFASAARVLFIARGTVLDHNLGYLHGSLLRALGHESEDLKTVLTQEDKEVCAPLRKPKRRRLDTPSTSYAAGNL
jgi:hypothetical protein